MSVVACGIGKQRKVKSITEESYCHEMCFFREQSTNPYDCYVSLLSDDDSDRDDDDDDNLQAAIQSSLADTRY